MIAPQLATSVLGAAIALGVLVALDAVAALELRRLVPNELVAPVVAGAAPITEHRYISFVAVSVISPLAAAAAISSSENSCRGVCPAVKAI